MALSAANVLQAKTATITTATTAGAVSLDDPAGTQDGSTVTIELFASGNPFTTEGLGGVVPDGFETDGETLLGGSQPYLWMFRKRDVTAGEGVAGSTSWDFTASAAVWWSWRVTEWDRGLEPVYPLERVSGNWVSGTGITTVSTGATGTTDRTDTVGLCWHHWQRSTATGQTFDWSGHTNGFTERDELRWTNGPGNLEVDDCWSWAFASTPTAHECTATVNLTTRDAQDQYMALLVVYAAAEPEIVAGPTVVSS